MKKIIFICLIGIAGLLLFSWRNSSLWKHESAPPPQDMIAEVPNFPRLTNAPANTPVIEALPSLAGKQVLNTNPYVWKEFELFGPKRVRWNAEWTSFDAKLADQDEKRRLEMQSNDLRLGINQDVREREEKLRSLTPRLHLGMSADQVVALLGEPSKVEALRGGKEHLDPTFFETITRTNQLFEKGFTYFRYSPAEGGRTIYDNSRDSFQIITIRFDADLKVGYWAWKTPINIVSHKSFKPSKP